MIPPNTAEIPTITSITCLRHSSVADLHGLKKEMSQGQIQKVLTEYALRSRVGNTAGVITTGLSYVTG